MLPACRDVPAPLAHLAHLDAATLVPRELQDFKDLPDLQDSLVIPRTGEAEDPVLKVLLALKALKALLASLDCPVFALNG